MAFDQTALALALAVLSLALVAAARCAAPYLMKSNNAQISSVWTKRRNTNARAAHIESKAEEEERMFVRRLDPQAFIVGFLNKEEEELFAKTRRDTGIKELRATFMLTVPFLALTIGTSLVAILEIQLGLSYASLARAQVVGAMAAVLALYLAAVYVPKKSVSTTFFPYVSVACASLIIAIIFIFIWTMVRVGALSGKSPWDGESRLCLAMLLIFLPRMSPMPIGFSTALNIVSVAALELLLFYLYISNGYYCSCYRVISSGSGSATVVSTSPIAAFIVTNSDPTASVA